MRCHALSRLSAFLDTSTTLSESPNSSLNTGRRLLRPRLPVRRDHAVDCAGTQDWPRDVQASPRPPWPQTDLSVAGECNRARLMVSCTCSKLQGFGSTAKAPI